MRELIFKNLTSGDKRKRDLYISEIVETNGIRTITSRHSVYKIGGHSKITDPKKLLEWKLNFPIHCNKRHVFILKKRDTRLKKDSFICDIVGKLYAVIKDDLYSIIFKHTFEVDFSSVAKQ